MEDDSSVLVTQEQSAAQQVLEAFTNLAPLFRDSSLKLEPNPKQPKQRRRDPPNRPKESSDKQDNQGEHPPVLQVLRALTNLVIKHDQELQSLRRMDQFILFLSGEPKGALHLMLQETKGWKETLEKKPPVQQPLRQHLILVLLKTLRSRAEQLVKATEKDELYQTSVQKGLMLQDRSFPFHRWDPTTQKLVLDRKTPISATKMEQHLDELLEELLDPQLVIRFHALKAPNPELASIPWRLQLNLRSDRPYELFHHLSHNGIWMLIGAKMKPHTQGQSGQATALQSMLMGQKGQGKGKSQKQTQKPLPKA